MIYETISSATGFFQFFFHDCYCIDVSAFVSMTLAFVEIISDQDQRRQMPCQAWHHDGNLLGSTVAAQRKLPQAHSIQHHPWINSTLYHLHFSRSNHQSDSPISVRL